jgi:hypothetical protein
VRLGGAKALDDAIIGDMPFGASVRWTYLVATRILPRRARKAAATSSRSAMVFTSIRAPERHDDIGVTEAERRQGSTFAHRRRVSRTDLRR